MREPERDTGMNIPSRTDDALDTTSWNLLSAHSITISAMGIDDIGLEAEFLAELSVDTRLLG